MLFALKIVAAFQLLGLASICNSSPASWKNKATIKRSASELADSYDYVVVGGGQSGLVVANRLTEDPTSMYILPQSVCASLALSLSLSLKKRN